MAVAFIVLAIVALTPFLVLGFKMPSFVVLAAVVVVGVAIKWCRHVFDRRAARRVYQNGLETEQRVSRDGIPATAKVLSLYPSGLRWNDDPVVRCKLEVTPRDRAPCVTWMSAVVPHSQASQIQVGQVFSANAAASDPQTVLVDFASKLGEESAPISPQAAHVSIQGAQTMQTKWTQCPKCNHDVFWCVDNVRIRTHIGYSLEGSDYQVYGCERCGYVEMYSADFSWFQEHGVRVTNPTAKVPQ